MVGVMCQYTTKSQFANLNMPQVLTPGKTIEYKCQSNLFKVLLENCFDLYNGCFQVISYGRSGSCGTCAVKVEGKVSVANWREQMRHSLPPQTLTIDLLHCGQVEVGEDVKIKKFEGFLGQGSQIMWTPEGSKGDKQDG